MDFGKLRVKPKSKFRVISIFDDEGIVICNCCGYTFNFDVHTERGLDWNGMHLVYKCPNCAQMGD